MIIRFVFIISCCSLFFFTACQSDKGSSTTKSNTSTVVDYAHLAKAYCECSEESIQLNNKMKTLLDAGNDQAFDAMVNSAKTAFEKAILCATTARKKHTAAAVDKKQMGAALKSDCSQMPPRLTLEMLDKVK